MHDHLPFPPCSKGLEEKAKLRRLFELVVSNTQTFLRAEHWWWKQFAASVRGWLVSKSARCEILRHFPQT